MSNFLSSFSPFLQKYKIEVILITMALIISCISGFIFYQSYQPNQNEEILIEKEPATKIPASIMIDLAGAVNQPGVYEVTSGARLKDAIDLAAGLTVEADTNFFNRNFNLARYLTDQEKIYIPSVLEIASGFFAETPRTLDYASPINPSVNSSGSQGETLQININSATVDELDTLPGIGKITAEKIIQNRPYKSIDELSTRKIVNKSVWEKIKSQVAIN